MKKVNMVIERYTKRNPFTADLVPEMRWHITRNNIKTLCGKKIKIDEDKPRKELREKWDGWEREDSFTLDGFEDCEECKRRKKKPFYKLFGWLLI